MHDDKAHPVEVADRDLLADITAACRWWAAQRTWQVSSSFTGGGVIAAFERIVACFVARDAAALALPSATIALVTALRTIGAKPGTTVGVPALGWAGLRATARALGISTRVLPVHQDTGLLDVAELGLVPSLTEDLVAVVAVHLNGLTCDVPGLRRARPGLPIIEDAAQAWAARYPDGSAVGSAADACVFSFSAASSPNAGELGCLATRQVSLHQRAVEMTQHPVRQLLTGTVAPKEDQLMTRVAPVVALMGAHAVQRHAAQAPLLRRAGSRLAAALALADLEVLSDAAVHAPGVIAVKAPPAQVREVVRDISLGKGVTIASIDQAQMHPHPDAEQEQDLRTLASSITTVTIAAQPRRGRH